MPNLIFAYVVIFHKIFHIFSNVKRSNLSMFIGLTFAIIASPAGLTVQSLQGRKEKTAMEDYSEYFETVRSDNGKYILAWSDSSPDDSLIGARNSGNGRYALFCEGMLLFKGELQRPNDGKVSNQGNFIINDWTFGEGNQGVFYAFDSKSNILISRRFKANLGPNAISSDGNFAACQALYSDNEDGNALAFFDLSLKILSWKAEPIPGPADELRFDSTNSTLHLIYNDGGDFRYDFQGHFLDEPHWQKKAANSVNGYDLLNLATDKWDDLKSKKAAPSDYEEVLSLLKRSIEKGISEYFQARAYRILGELSLKMNQRFAAIDYFEKAISANPRIGVKKLLAKLKTENP